MAIINFSVAPPLADKINTIIKEWGFASKAEFFRFLAINFVERHQKKIRTDKELAYLSEEFEKAIDKKYKNKKIPSFEDQTEDLL